MILTVKNRKVTLDNTVLAFQEDNKVTTITTNIEDAPTGTFVYKLDVIYANGLTNIIDLNVSGSSGTVTITNDMVPVNGKVVAQIRRVGSDESVYHTDTFNFWVKYSIIDADTYNPVPSEFLQSEARIEELNAHPPKPDEDGEYWDLWNVKTHQYVKSTIPLPSFTSAVQSVNGKVGHVVLNATDVGAQPTLVSGTNIKTINNQTILGAGNLQIDGGVTSVNGKTGAVTLNYSDVGADASGAASTVQGNLNTHIANKTNPHEVTKAQVGLGNVDNTADLSKPISTATQTALNAKQNTLVSGSNIKTINNTSILGSGNLDTSEIFIATPYETTFNELNTALNNNKIIIAKDSGEDTYFYVLQDKSGGDNNFFTFVKIYLDESSTMLSGYMVGSDNEWNELYQELYTPYEVAYGDGETTEDYTTYLGKVINAGSATCILIDESLSTTEQFLIPYTSLKIVGSNYSAIFRSVYKINNVYKYINITLSTSGWTKNVVNLFDGYSTTTQMNTAIANHHDDTKANIVHTQSWSTITDKPTIPSKTSDLTNDSGFVDSSYHDSSKADVSTTYTKSEVDSAISGHHDSTKADASAITDMATKTWVEGKGYLTQHQDISGKENTSNKVTSISSASTDSQYPSAKCVYDIVGNIESTLQEIRGGVSYEYFNRINSTPGGCN